MDPNCRCPSCVMAAITTAIEEGRKQLLILRRGSPAWLELREQVENMVVIQVTVHNMQDSLENEFQHGGMPSIPTGQTQTN